MEHHNFLSATARARVRTFLANIDTRTDATGLSWRRTYMAPDLHGDWVINALYGFDGTTV